MVSNAMQILCSVSKIKSSFESPLVVLSENRKIIYLKVHILLMPAVSLYFYEDLNQELVLKVL